MQPPLCWLRLTGAFAGGAYDQDDKEADEIWDAVDSFMDERRRVSSRESFRGGLEAGRLLQGRAGSSEGALGTFLPTWTPAQHM